MLVIGFKELLDLEKHIRKTRNLIHVNHNGNVKMLVKSGKYPGEVM